MASKGIADLLNSYGETGGISEVSAHRNAYSDCVNPFQRTMTIKTLTFSAK